MWNNHEFTCFLHHCTTSTHTTVSFSWCFFFKQRVTVHLLQSQWPLRRLSVFYMNSNLQPFIHCPRCLTTRFPHLHSSCQKDNLLTVLHCSENVFWGLNDLSAGVTVSQYHDDWAIRRVDLAVTFGSLNIKQMRWTSQLSACLWRSTVIWGGKKHYEWKTND